MAGQVISKLAKINSLWWLKRYSIRWSKGSSASKLWVVAGWTCPVPAILLSGSYPGGQQRVATLLWWDAPRHSWLSNPLKTELRSMPMWGWWPTHGSEVTRTDDTMQVAVMVSRIPLQTSWGRVWINAGFRISTWKGLGAAISLEGGVCVGRALCDIKKTSIVSIKARGMDGDYGATWCLPFHLPRLL